MVFSILAPPMADDQNSSESASIMVQQPPQQPSTSHSIDIVPLARTSAAHDPNASFMAGSSMEHVRACDAYPLPVPLRIATTAAGGAIIAQPVQRIESADDARPMKAKW